MNPLSRRRALRLLAVTAVAPAFTRAAAPAPSALPSFDHEMQLFMTERAIPGGALAIVKDRHLIYARGYGRADRDHPAPVTATSRFRIASLSKPVTAAAVFKLIEDKKLALDDRAFTRLPLKSLLPADATPDERLARITLRQLLQHTAGWDRDKTYDPMFRTKQIATELGLAPPAGPRDIIRHHLGKPLDFDPGTRYAYSNFGYCLLGRIIEEISGETYEAFTRRAVLAPAGTRQMQLGKSPATARATDEVRYHTPDNAMGENLFAPDGPKVPWPDGGFALESMDANGGWIASVIDLARFVAALDPAAPRPLLTRAVFDAMHAPPPPPVSRNDDGTLKAAYYACGWNVRPVGTAGKFNAWHTGSLPGTYTLLVRRWDGLSWAALFNQRSLDHKTRDAAIDPALHRAAAAVEKWPTEDLFPRSP